MPAITVTTGTGKESDEEGAGGSGLAEQELSPSVWRYITESRHQGSGGKSCKAHLFVG